MWKVFLQHIWPNLSFEKDAHSAALRSHLSSWALEFKGGIMAIKVSLINMKGGVGKSTVTVNLGLAFCSLSELA